jgi:hypothetical protein
VTRLSALVLALLTATTGLAVAAAPATAETAIGEAGEVVLPPVYGDKVPALNAILGSPAAFAWAQDGVAPSGEPGGGGATARYSVYGGAQRVRIPGASPEGMSLVGSQLIYTTQNERKAVDVTTGAPLTLPAGGATSGTGDGWLQTNSAGVAKIDAATGQKTSYAYPWTDHSAYFGFRPHVSDVDSRGVLLWLEDWDDESVNWSIFVYLDFATGAWTLLAEQASTGEIGNIEAGLTDDEIVWGLNGVVHWHDRSDPANLKGEKSVGYGINNLTAGRDSVAFVRYARRTTGAKLEFLVYSGPVKGPYTRVESDIPTMRLMVEADDGDFAVGAGDTVGDRGMYRLHPGATKLSEPIALFGPGAPLGIEASAGRLVTVTPRKARTAEGRAVLSDAEAESLTTGASSTLTAKLPDATPPELSGGHSAYLTGEGDARVAVVQDGPTEIARHAVPPSAHAVRLSGHRLLVAADGASVVIDLDTGGRTAVPYTRAIFGEAIAYLLPTGEIRRRDLRTGDETVLREPGLPAGRAEPLAPRRAVLELHGDWALWSLPPVYEMDESDRGPAPLETTALNVITRQRTDLVTGINAALGQNAEIRLAGGVAAWIDQESRTVHVADLSAGTTRAVGEAWRLYSEPRSWLALTDEFVAWVAPDDSTHLLPLGAAAEGAPRYLGTVDANTFSAAGADYRPQIDVSRPLTSWTLTITAPAPSGAATAAVTGTVVRTLKGSARSGGVRPAWNGLRADGTKVPDGVYTWTLTGTGIGGTLRRADGSTGVIKGTVRVDSTTPAPTVSSPLRAGVTGFTVRWSSAERGVKFTVTVARRKIGAATWSTPRTWRSDTTVTSARYVGTPYALRKGYAYRITVTAVDAVGNKRATSVVTRIPA